ncbi:hypothetical protein MBAV_003030 [Candidatus Magnetobacterium bavaricum]|uniref:Uncharacterized protein n=1 Tax=Candidatus Magnetobacterium bavaricum TaxID=29290 RepID=A0A0F3GSI8_9BACT|nr:hypothetical protein MBAV_003030 [Candidatus Magnetobacterium bavaricum]
MGSRGLIRAFGRCDLLRQNRASPPGASRNSPLLCLFFTVSGMASALKVRVRGIESTFDGLITAL